MILSRASIGGRKPERRATSWRRDQPKTTQTTSYIVTVIIKGGGWNLTPMSRGLVVITRLVGWGGMKRVAMVKEATFIKALISSLGKV